MTEAIIGVIFFRSQPYLKEDDKPSEKDYPLIQMQPGTSLVALINIPLGQEDDSITVGMTSYEDVAYPEARVTFSYPNNLGELSVDDDRHRHLPPKYIKKEKINQIVINRPRMRYGLKANRFHIWMCKPMMAQDIYDFEEYNNPSEIPVDCNYIGLIKQGSLLKSKQHDMDKLNTKYNGGRDFKKEIQELAKLKCLKNYTSEDWMIKRRESKRHIKRKILQAKHEVERMEYITASVNNYMLMIIKQKEQEVEDRRAMIKPWWKRSNVNNVHIPRMIDTARRILTFGWAMEAGRQLLNDDIFILIPIIPASKLGCIPYIIIALLNLWELVPMDIEWWRENFCPSQGGEVDQDQEEKDREDRSHDQQYQLQRNLGAANWIKRFIQSSITKIDHHAIK